MMLEPDETHRVVALGKTSTQTLAVLPYTKLKISLTPTYRVLRSPLVMMYTAGYLKAILASHPHSPLRVVIPANAGMTA